MIDIHAHILPGMDDGSKSVEESIEMLTEMKQQGVKAVVATPHFDMRRESIDDFLERREKSFRKLLEGTRELELPQVLLGAEVLYCGVGLSRIEEIEKLCLGNGRCLLVETLKAEWDDAFATDMLKLLAEQNITPVLAHVERVCHSRRSRKTLYSLQQQGVMAQCNAEFFLSWRSSRRAIKMLKEKRIQLLGSDCHNMRGRKPNLANAIETIQKKLGSRIVEKVTARTEKILFGEIQ